jgi:hypothetical protein
MSEPQSEAQRAGDNVFALPNAGHVPLADDRREGRWSQRVWLALLVFALLGLAVQTARSRSLARDAAASAAELAAVRGELAVLREQVATTRDRVAGLRQGVSAIEAELVALERDLGGDPDSAAPPEAEAPPASAESGASASAGEPIEP